MTEHSFNLSNAENEKAATADPNALKSAPRIIPQTAPEWAQFGTHTNRYTPTMTPEQRSARVTESVLFTLKGAKLTMEDALKIAEVARECATDAETASAGGQENG